MSNTDDNSPAQASTSAGGTAQATVTVINRQLNIAPFKLTNDSNDTAVRWNKWKWNIARQFRYFGIEDPQLKKDGLIIYGGPEIADLDDCIPDPTHKCEHNVYTSIIHKLDQHFLPKKNKDYARFLLESLAQYDDEPMATYFARGDL